MTLLVKYLLIDGAIIKPTQEGHVLRVQVDEVPDPDVVPTKGKPGWPRRG